MHLDSVPSPAIAASRKLDLYRRWFERNVPRTATLFLPDHRAFVLSVDARSMLSRCSEPGMHLYVMALPSQEFHVPVYIGKSTAPEARWRTGHMVGLNRGKSPSYARWRACLEPHRSGAFLFVLHEREIVDPPLPGFPTTVGAVEYQLVSLASGFSPMLLNNEGVAR